MSDQTKGVLYTLVAVFLWGFLPLAMKVALQFDGPIELSFYRFASAFAVSLTCCFFNRNSREELPGVLTWPLFFSGIFLGFNYWGYAKGISLTTPTNTNLVIQTGPILLALAGRFVLNESFSLRTWLGLVIAFSGMGLFFLDRMQEGPALLEYWQGNFWIFSAAVSWVIYALLQKKNSQKISALAKNSFVFLVASLFLIPFCSFDQISSYNWKVFALFLFLGLNTFFAYLAIAKALQLLPANKMSAIITFNPLLTLLIMSFFPYAAELGIETEPLTILGTLGAMLVVVGSWAVVSAKRNS